MACLYKGLKVEGIPMRFCEKEKIKFAGSDKARLSISFLLSCRNLVRRTNP